MKKFLLLGVLSLFIGLNAQERVGINTTDPQATLDVRGHVIIGNNDWTTLKIDGPGENDWIFNTHSDGETLHIRTQENGNPGGSLFHTSFLRNGRIGIGTGSPVAKLDVNGDIRAASLAGGGIQNVVADNEGKLIVVPNIRTVTTNITLAETDNNTYIYVNSSSTTVITIPSTLSIGFSCVVVQKGTGSVNITGSGVNLETARGIRTRKQYSAIGIIKDTSSTATITGDAIN